MKLHLKLKIKRLAQEARNIKQVEFHHKSRMRALLNRWPTRHQLGAEYPKRPDFVKRADAWGDKQSAAALQAAVDEQFAKFWGLERYRKYTVRPQLRHAHLAYGFLKGKRYDQIESMGCHQAPNFNEVQRMIEKFSDDDIRVVQQRWAEWKDDAAKALVDGAHVEGA